MNSRGFSLIELLLVIAIILTLGVMSAVFYSRFLTQNSVSNAADVLAGELRKAQIYATSGKQDSSWGVSYTGNVITLFATRSAVFNENTSINSNITVGGFSSVIFAKTTGIPNTTFTASISGQNNFKNVSVNAQGVVNR